MRFSLSLVIFLAACGGHYVVDSQEQLYTQINLRANARGQMTSVQEWRGTEVVPICTPVQIDAVGAREIRFTGTQSGQRFRYILHRSTRLPVDDHVQRMFGSTCPAATLDQQDAMGIQDGVPLPGMTRAGVVMAVGYPPEHRTPTLAANEWVYWGTAGNVSVHFDGDLVAYVDDPAAPSQQIPQPVAQPVQGDLIVDAPGYAPATATVVVQPAAPVRESRRERRRRRLQAVGTGVAVAGAVAVTVTPAATTQTTTVSNGGSAPSQPSGCQSMTINGSLYTDHHGTPFMQDCSVSVACPSSYVCVIAMGDSGWCMPEEGQRCR